MLKKQFLVLVFILWLQNSSGFIGTLTSILSGAGMIVDFIKTLPSAVESVKELFTSVTTGWSQPDDKSHLDDKSHWTGPTAKPELDKDVVPESGNDSLRHKMEELHDTFGARFEALDVKFNDLKLFASNHFEIIEDLIQNLPQEIEILRARQILGKYVKSINQRWQRMKVIVKKGVTAEVYSHMMWSNMRYINRNLDKFRYSILPDRVGGRVNGLLASIALMQKDERHVLCDGETSHNSVIHLFQSILSTEMKTIILQTLATNDKYPGKKGWRREADKFTNRLIRMIKDYVEELLAALRIEERPHIRACHDQVGSVQDYHDVLHFRNSFQRRMTSYQTHTVRTTDKNGGDPADDCDFAISCGIAEKVHFVPIVLTSCQKEWDTFVDSCYCKKHLSVILQNTEEMMEENDVNNRICTCLMYAKFVLTLMQGRVKDNFVVVGMRFQKQDNYIYIQIAEGKLETNGHISNYTWITSTKKANGQDPFEASLTINEGKTMALGDTQLPPSYILTGIKFVPQLVYGEKGFKIGLYGVKFEYETGILDLTDETFVLAPDLPRIFVLRRSRWSKQQKPIEYTSVEFSTTDDKNSTSSEKLTKLDVVPVLPTPLLAIGGVGIFHQNASDGTPYLSLRLFPLDYTIFKETLSKLDIRSCLQSNASCFAVDQKF